MSQVKLAAKIRKETGKGVARKLRRQGRVPAVLYGHHLEQPIVLDVDSKDVEQILSTHGKTAIINVVMEDGSDSQMAMLTDYQRDVFGTILLHVDFKQVRMDEKVTASIPVMIVGDSIGVKNGGVLEHHLRSVEIEGLPMSIPSNLTLDVTNLDLGHHLTVADVQCPEGVEIKADPSESVVSIAIPRAVAVAESEEEAPAEAEASAE